MGYRAIELSENGILLYESNHKEGDMIEEHHHHIYQILYAIEGEGQVKLADKEYPFVQDNAVVIPPYCNHSIQTDRRLTLLVLAFDEMLLDSFAQKQLLSHFFYESQLLKLNPFSASESRQLLRKMLYEQSHQDPLNHWALKIFLFEILLVLARTHMASQQLDVNSLRAERIRNYIDTHFFEALSAEHIAAKLNISVRYMNNIFKDQYQITPIQYLTEVRVERSKKLLLESDKDIITICFEVGYETLSTFYRTFKNAVGVSPNKYRQSQSITNGRKDEIDVSDISLR